MKALIVEDDLGVAESVSLCLQLRIDGINATIASEGLKAVEMVKSERIDIIILDINLPDIDGFEVLKRIRRFSNVPVIIVSVRASEKDRVLGLDLGADDYITKPFSSSDLGARVRALLRRTQPNTTGEESKSITLDDIGDNATNTKVKIGGRVVELSPYESKLLRLLMRNEGKPVSIKEIMDEIWEHNYADSQLVEFYIAKLHEKLNDNPPKIIVYQGISGYRFYSPEK